MPARAVPRITGLVQGVTYRWQLGNWRDDANALITIDPAEHYAEAIFVQYAEVTPADETNLVLTGGTVLGKLSTRGQHAPLALYADRLDITVPRSVTRKWPLQAAQDRITRTETPTTATYTYADQILWLDIKILRHDGDVSVFPNPFSYELEMEPRLDG